MSRVSNSILITRFIAKLSQTKYSYADTFQYETTTEEGRIRFLKRADGEFAFAINTFEKAEARVGGDVSYDNTLIIEETWKDIKASSMVTEDPNQITMDELLKEVNNGK